jgi:nitroreductase
MKKSSSDVKDALSVIYSRKSVRNYTDEAVNKDDVIGLVRAGMAAPSAVDRRPWAFVAVTERATLDRLSKTTPFSSMLKKAGAAIVVCGIPMKSLVKMKLINLVSGVSNDYWVQDCSAATENILLAAEAKGLGAVWIGIHPVEAKVDTVRKILSIPDSVTPLNIISIGHPAGKEKPKNKFDSKNIHWEKW